MTGENIPPAETAYDYGKISFRIWICSLAAAVVVFAVYLFLSEQGITDLWQDHDWALNRYFLIPFIFFLIPFTGYFAGFIFGAADLYLYRRKGFKPYAGLILNAVFLLLQLAFYLLIFGGLILNFLMDCLKAID